MELYNILLTSVIISLVCSGLGILMDYQKDEPKYKQPLLYWLRKPFVDYKEGLEQVVKEETKKIRKIEVEANGTILKIDKESIIKDMQDSKDKGLAYQFYLKPFVLCVYCYPSFWGSLTFIALHGISLTLVPYLIISIIGAIPLVALFYGIYEKF